MGHYYDHIKRNVIKKKLLDLKNLSMIIYIDINPLLTLLK